MLMKRSRALTIIIILAISFMMPKKVDAQIIEIGATGGLSYYIGDINPGKHFSQSDLGLGGVIRYYNDLRWAFRFQYSNMTLQSSDEVVGFRPERGLAFNSKVNDFALIAEFNFFEYWTGSKQNFITPYLFAGVSVFSFNPKAPNGTELQPLNTEGNFVMDDEGNPVLDGDGNPIPDLYSKFSWSIPFGIGIKYSLTNRIGLTLEWRIHKSFTDYIDDIHGNYPEYEVGSTTYNNNYTDPTGNFEPGMQRGNGDDTTLGYNKDWYSMLGLSVVYRFNLPNKAVCNSGIKPRK